MKNQLLLGFILCVCCICRADAGCKTDCSDDYESAREDCASTHDEPDEADDLKQCIDDAKDEYDSCVHECNS